MGHGFKHFETLATSQMIYSLWSNVDITLFSSAVKEKEPAISAMTSFTAGMWPEVLDRFEPRLNHKLTVQSFFFHTWLSHCVRKYLRMVI